MNKFSIFHTSHCGSTLLASLISRSIESYAEPGWSRQLWYRQPNSFNLDRYLSDNHPDNSVIKYSSPLCRVSPHLPDKKVFLYRRLKEHMQKALLHGDFIYYQTEIHLEAMKDHHHPIVDAIPLSGTHLHVCAYLWVDRWMWMREASNVLWIDSNDFFDNIKGTAELVCNHFGVPYTTLDIPFHVKNAGLNKRDTPINVDDVEELHKDMINPVDAKIVHFTHNDMINEIIEQVRKLFPMIEDKFID
jgi:hypothetical protein